MITSEDLRFFAVVARSGSVAAAARRLGVTPSAAGQRLAALEQRVGVRLADRDRRGLRLTDEGRLLADRAAPLVTEIDDLSDALAARREEVGGHLHVVASLGFGRRHVALLAARFREYYPAVTLDLTLTAARVPAGAYDLWVHIGELRETSLVGRRLAPNDRWLVAAPAYLADAGTPATPADLVDHAPLVLRENEEDTSLWRFTRDGREDAVRVTPALASNDGEVLRTWALDGLGVMVRSEWHVADDVRAGRLVRVLPEYTLPPPTSRRYSGPDVAGQRGRRRSSTSCLTRSLRRRGEVTRIEPSGPSILSPVSEPAERPPPPRPVEAPAREAPVGLATGARWFAAEFLVVVTGVLVALAVGAWWQGRQDAATERAYLRQLAADLRETEQATLAADAFLRPVDRAGSLLWLAFYESDPPPRDSLLAWAERSMWTSTVRPVLGTAEALVATGDLALIRDDSLRTAVTAYLERTRGRLYDHEQFDRWAGAERRMRRQIDPTESALTHYEPAVLDGFLAEMGVPEADLTSLGVPFTFDPDVFLGRAEALQDAFELANAKRNLLTVRRAMREDARVLRERVEAELAD